MRASVRRAASRCSGVMCEATSLIGGGEHRGIVGVADHREIIGNDIGRQHEISERADEDGLHLERRLPIERAIMRGNQIFDERQLRREAPQLAPKSAPHFLLVGGETARQRFGVNPRCAIVPERHLPGSALWISHGRDRMAAKGGSGKAKRLPWRLRPL